MLLQNYSIGVILKFYLKPIKVFKVIHQDIINGRRTPVKVSINGYTSAGYANKLYSMLSSLVIALLTDSAFIIRWKYISEFIEEPFNSTFATFNSNNDFNADYKKKTIHSISPKQSWQENKDLNTLINTSIPTNKHRFVYNQYNPLFFEICSNPIYYEKLKYYELVSEWTVENALTKINDYEKFSKNDKLNSVLQVGYEVGGNLLNKMWIPKKTIRDRVEYYYNKYFKGYYVIGIQLRYQYIDKVDTTTFLNCAKYLETELVESLESLGDSFNSTYKGVKWFMTSDNEHILKKLVVNYKNKVIVTTETMGHVEYKKSSYPRAIIDVELLSRCNELIITGGSTYGFVAAMKSLKQAYYVNGKSNMLTCRLHELSSPSLTNNKSGFAVF